MLSEVAYSALLAYSPRGTTPVSQKSRRVCYDIKSGDRATLQRAMEHLHTHASAEQVLEHVLGENVVLVPMPRSAPLVAGALWPAKAICDAIVGAGLAARVAPVLTRVSAVRKSATAAPGERPSVSQNYETLNAHADLDFGERIVVVDDVITKGNTALAAASRISEAYIEIPVSIFALVRTKGLVPDIDQIVDPVTGNVSLVGDEGLREP